MRFQFFNDLFNKAKQRHYETLEAQHRIELERYIQKAHQERQRLTIADLSQKVEIPTMDATIEELEKAYGAGVWIYSCTNVISEKLATPEWIFVNEKDEPQENPLPMKPNHTMSWNLWRQTVQLHLDLTGNAYVMIDRSNPQELQFDVIRPSRVRVVPSKDGTEIIGYAVRKPDSKGSGKVEPIQLELTNGNEKSELWRVGTQLADTSQSKRERIETIYKMANASLRGDLVNKTINADDWIPVLAKDMMHWKYAHPSSNYYGAPPMQPLILPFSTEMFARRWNENFFKNGAIPPIAIMYPDAIDEGEFNRITQQYKDKHAGIDNAWKPLMIGHAQEGAQIIPINNSHTDMDFLNLLRTTREETLAVFNVPPVMVGIFQFSTGSSRSAGAEDQRTMFWTDTIIPKEKIWEDVMNMADIGIPDGIKFKFDNTSIEALKANLAEDAKTGQALIMGGGWTLQEVRSGVYNKPEEVEGDLYLPTSIQTVTETEAGETVTETVHFEHTKITSLEMQRTNLWKGIIAEVDTMENALFLWEKSIFRSQRDRYLVSTTTQFNKSQTTTAKQKALDDITDDLDAREVEETLLYTELSTAKYTELVEASAELALNRANITGGFDLLNENVIDFINEKAIAFADEVNATTTTKLRKQFEEAIQAGEGIDLIQLRIEDVFKDTIRGTASRARMIARTEMTGIYNGSSKLAYQQHDDVVEGVEWLSSRDARVRATHRAADGQVRDLNQPFLVGSSLLRYPGDPQGSAAEVIRCRCVLLPRLS